MLHGFRRSWQRADGQVVPSSGLQRRRCVTEERKGEAERKRQDLGQLVWQATVRREGSLR
eukprot:2217947-Pleurochrysis_carterae.AAC.5